MLDQFRSLFADILLPRIAVAYTNLPAWREWGEAALIFAGYCAIALPMGLASGMLEYKPSQDSLGKLALVAGIAFFVPSLLEETLYRAFLLPGRHENASLESTFGQAALAIALFVAGHPLVAWLFAPDARKLFYDPVFLALSALFGVATSLVYLRTGSIWPCVAMHWLLVVGWAYWLGGWIMALGPAK